MTRLDACSIRAAVCSVFVAVVAVVVAPVSAAFAADSSFTFASGAPGSPGYSGPCQIASVAVAVDPAVVAPPFVPIMAAGKAVGQVSVLDCPVGVDGAPARPGRQAELTVFVVPPDGTAGLHGYQVSLLTTDPEIGSRLRALGYGMFAETVAGMTFARSGFGLTSISGVVPWSFSSYALTALVTEPAPLVPLVATGWFNGPLGIVRFAFSNSHIRVGAGLGTITAQHNSTLAHWMGASRVTGAATLIVADITAKVQPCGASPAGCPAPTG